MTPSWLDTPKLLLLGTILVAGCGEDAATSPAPADPRVCSLSWRTIYAPDDQAFRSPSGEDGEVMVVNRGQVYLNENASVPPRETGMWSLPIAGGPPARIHEGSPRVFWVEDDDLIFVEGSTLRRMRLSGADPEPISTFHVFDPPSHPLVLAWALDRDALYWQRDDYVSLTLWRSPRDGSGDQQVATVPPDDEVATTGRRTIVIGDEIFVTARQKVWTVPKTGGELQPVPSTVGIDGGPLGIASDGSMLWWRGVGDPYHYRKELVRVGRDAGPGKTLWTYDPGVIQISRAWSDGNGGWFLAASETATDGGGHTTVWWLDTSDQLTRIGCDPEIERWVSAGQTDGDHLYLLARDANSWEVAEVARQR